jgi:hypothetical protein
MGAQPIRLRVHGGENELLSVVHSWFVSTPPISTQSPCFTFLIGSYHFPGHGWFISCICEDANFFNDPSKIRHTTA